MPGYGLQRRPVDSLTHIVLGAALGGVTPGRRTLRVWRDDEGEPWFAFRLRHPGGSLVIERIPCGRDLGDYGERLQALFVRMLGM